MPRRWSVATLEDMRDYRITLDGHDVVFSHSGKLVALKPHLLTVTIDIAADSPQEAAVILGDVLTELVAENRERFGFVKDAEK